MLPFAKLVAAGDEVDLREWIRTSRALEVYSLVIRPPDVESFDAKPHGCDSNMKLLYAQLIFGTQFARLNHQRSRVGSPVVEEDLGNL